jgi:hypothetical protein
MFKIFFEVRYFLGIFFAAIFYFVFQFQTHLSVRSKLVTLTVTRFLWLLCCFVLASAISHSLSALLFHCLPITNNEIDIRRTVGIAHLGLKSV